MVGKTGLITGATGGIGKATALGLAGMGAHLAIIGRDRGRTDAAAQELQAAGVGQVRGSWEICFQAQLRWGDCSAALGREHRPGRGDFSWLIDCRCRRPVNTRSNLRASAPSVSDRGSLVAFGSLGSAS